MRHRALLAAAIGAILLAGCLPESSPSASSSSAPPASLEPSPSVNSTPEPTATPSPTPEPTPDQAAVPQFAAGALVSTRTVVRVRDLPGQSWGVAATLQRGALLQVVLGPVHTAAYGWYLVRDVDPAAPSFREGWVAAGFSPNAFLAAAPTATPPPNSPLFVAGFSGAADGDFGPFRLEGSTALRWALALPIELPEGASCTFSGALHTQDGQPVPFLHTTVADTPAPGTTQPSFFAAHPALSGDLFLHVETDCSWALSVVRLPL